jgi:hypothetical protein
MMYIPSIIEIVGVCALVLRTHHDLYCMGTGDLNPRTMGLPAGF